MGLTCNWLLACLETVDGALANSFESVRPSSHSQSPSNGTLSHITMAREDVCRLHSCDPVREEIRKLTESKLPK